MRTGKQKRCRGISILLTAAMIFSLVGSVHADDTAGNKLRDWFEAGSASGAEVDYGDQEPAYYERLQEYKEQGLEEIQGASYSFTTDDIVTKLPEDAVKDGVLNWTEDIETVEWKINVEKAGLYELRLEYCPLKGSDSTIEREVLINGEYLFSECHNIPFYRSFKDESVPKLNSLGDQVKPTQIEIFEWDTISFCDKLGYYTSPLTFPLKAGENKIQLKMLYEPMQIGKLMVCTPKKVPTYSEVLSEYQSKGYSSASARLKFQAEDTVQYRSNPTLRAESDSDPLLEPKSTTSRVFNMIGDYWWRSGGQSITWQFDVTESGLYQIGLRDRQIWNDGLPSYRTIQIDGEVPYQEFLAYEFKYNKYWRSEVLADKDKNPYLIYLDKGIHMLTMTVTVSPYTDMIESIRDDMVTFSRVYRQITMITGSEPDINYDYELFRTIPDLSDTISELEASMTKKYEYFNSVSSKKSSMANNFKQIAKQMRELGENPFIIPRRIDDLENAQINLGSYYTSLTELPLGIDYFVFLPAEDTFANYRSNVFQKIGAAIQSFVISFFKDYDNVGSTLGADLDQQELESISVWIARGNEWAEQLIELSDEYFTPDSKVRVKLNVLPAGALNTGTSSVLMFALSSGNAPDVALGISYGTPTELAIRDAVTDLTQFDDFSEVKKRFLEKLFIPLEFKGGVYALPETINFRMMFYRKDILKELNMTVPETWTDLYKNVFPVLNQNGMEFSCLAELSPFLFQRGGSYYNEEGTESALDTPEAYDAFKELCDLYTNYGVPVSANFLTRFRTGEMPMGISDYSMYISLMVAAPELLGRWGIAQIPGTLQEDGTIDHSFGSAGAEACMIFSSSKKQEASWKFLKWWMDTDTQLSFSRNLEASMGIAARFNTANVQAFTELNWDKDDLLEIKKSLNWATEVPVVLGGYYTGRQVTNAWNRVVTRDLSAGGDLTDTNVRDSLELAVEDINRELKAQQDQYELFMKSAK